MVGYTVDVSIKTLKWIIPSAKEGGPGNQPLTYTLVD